MSKLNIIYINKSNPKVQSISPSKGDLIVDISVEKYRNNGIYLYNGSNSESLYTEIDDYGSLPPWFSYPEFKLNTWTHMISCNSIQWIKLIPSLKKQLIKNIKINKDSEFSYFETSFSRQEFENIDKDFNLCYIPSSIMNISYFLDILNRAEILQIDKDIDMNYNFYKIQQEKDMDFNIIGYIDKAGMYHVIKI